MCLTELVALLIMTAAAVDGFPNGAPKFTCGRMLPSPDTGNAGHGATPTTDVEFPYEVTFNKTSFKADDTVDVTVVVKSGQDTATNFRGVLLQARKGSSPDTAEYLGTLNCYPGIKNAITHRDNTNKTSETVRWTAPASSVLSSDVVFRVTVVQVKEIFWVKKDSSTLKYSTTSGAITFTLSTALVVAVTLSQLLYIFFKF